MGVSGRSVGWPRNNTVLCRCDIGPAKDEAAWQGAEVVLVVCVCEEEAYLAEPKKDCLAPKFEIQKITINVLVVVLPVSRKMYQHTWAAPLGSLDVSRFCYKGSMQVQSGWMMDTDKLLSTVDTLVIAIGYCLLVKSCGLCVVNDTTPLLTMHFPQSPSAVHHRFPPATAFSHTHSGPRTRNGSAEP